MHRNRPDPTALLEGARAGLALAVQSDWDDHAREADGWRAVGLVVALQGCLAAALLAYDTAQASDVLAPTGKTEPTDSAGAKLAPVSLLLRRASSPDFLADPERLSLSRADRRALDALMDRRNRQLHPGTNRQSAPGEDPAAERAAAKAVLTHLVAEHPAFPAGVHDRICQEIATLLDRLD